jgi:hypothetical protein
MADEELTSSSERTGPKCEDSDISWRASQHQEEEDEEEEPTEISPTTLFLVSFAVLTSLFTYR